MYKMKMMSQNLSDGLSDERQELLELLFATKNLLDYFFEPMTKSYHYTELPRKGTGMPSELNLLKLFFAIEK